MTAVHKVLAGLLLCGAMSVLDQGRAVEIIAHRGASAEAPENTLPAMKLAWDQGADAIELDLWLSRDGKVVVFHDSDTQRFDGQKRRVSDLAWEQMRELDVGAWKGPEFKGERIPRLQDILATVPPGRRAVLEIKCGPEILPELRRLLSGAGRSSNELAIISFNFQTIQESKKLFPGMEHYFLHSYKRDPETGRYPELADLLARCRQAGLDGLDLHYDWPIDADFVRKVHDAGMKLIVWTVDDATVARRMARAGVDGITTNRPKWLRDRLEAGGE